MSELTNKLADAISSMSPALGKAMAWAFEHHTRETFLHVTRVARYLVGTAPNDGTVDDIVPIVATIAYLHDIVEDTTVKLSDIENDSLFKDCPVVCEVVGLLTRDSNMTYFNYIRMVRTHPIARMVKFADIQDHLNEKDTLSNSLKVRYEKAMIILDGPTPEQSILVH